MTIHLYLNEENEKHIMTFYDAQANPFKLGDEINLTVNEIPPNKYAEFNKDFQIKMELENREQKGLFHLKKIKLVREGKYLEVENGKLTIEYHCDFIEEKE